MEDVSASFQLWEAPLLLVLARSVDMQRQHLQPLKPRTASLNTNKCSASRGDCHSHPRGTSPLWRLQEEQRVCLAASRHHRLHQLQPSCQGMRPCDQAEVTMRTMQAGPATMTRWDLPEHPKTTQPPQPTYHSAG